MNPTQKIHIQAEGIDKKIRFTARFMGPVEMFFSFDGYGKTLKDWWIEKNDWMHRLNGNLPFHN